MDNSATIEFLDATDYEANLYIQQIESIIKDASNEVEIHKQKNPTSQDGGTSLIVAILSIPAVTEIAKGIANWMAREPKTKIVIKSGDNELTVEGFNPKRATEIAKILSTAVTKSKPQLEEESE